MNVWTPASRELPPENIVVLALMSDGTEELMSRKGGLWFRVGEDMYVFYRPLYWRMP